MLKPAGAGAYRADTRARCSTCTAPITANDGVFAPSGELQCRVCSNTALVQRTSAAVAAETYDRGIASPGWAHARWLLLPGAALCAICVLQLLHHWANPRSCSEMGCVGLILVPWLGLAVTGPTTFAAALVAPGQDRAKIVLGGLGLIMVMTLTCAAPL